MFGMWRTDPTPRLVLDTNVCLDLFVFHDPASLPLGQALAQGHLAAHAREDCRDEWLRVLGYPALKLDAQQRNEAEKRFDAFVITHAVESLPNLPSPSGLPRCKDRDDQKFLEAALQIGAQAVLSKDSEVLALARRVERAGLFRILQPQQWRTLLPAPPLA